MRTEERRLRVPHVAANSAERHLLSPSRRAAGRRASRRARRHHVTAGQRGRLRIRAPTRRARGALCSGLQPRVWRVRWRCAGLRKACACKQLQSWRGGASRRTRLRHARRQRAARYAQSATLAAQAAAPLPARCVASRHELCWLCVCAARLRLREARRACAACADSDNLVKMAQRNSACQRRSRQRAQQQQAVLVPQLRHSCSISDGREPRFKLRRSLHVQLRLARGASRTCSWRACMPEEAYTLFI